MWFFGHRGFFTYGLTNVRYGNGLSFRAKVFYDGNVITFCELPIGRGLYVFEFRRLPTFGLVFYAFLRAVWDSHVGSDRLFADGGRLFVYGFINDINVGFGRAFFGHRNLPLILGILVFYCFSELIQIKWVMRFFGNCGIFAAGDEDVRHVKGLGFRF